MEFEEIIDRIYPLDNASKSLLREKLTELCLPKGHILLQADKIEKTVYFIKEGIVRAYVDQAEHEVTFWFGWEGEVIISMRSYVENKRSYESIELLSDCQLYALNSNDLQDLYKSNVEIANWGRKLAEMELIKLEERLIECQFQTASERYQNLLEKYPHVLRRVQLGYIASYLGITQVSLSRIRAEIR